HLGAGRHPRGRGVSNGDGRRHGQARPGGGAGAAVRVDAAQRLDSKRRREAALPAVRVMSATPARPSTLVELAAAIAGRRSSSREAVEWHLRRIEEVNPRLNAVVTLADDALERADAA